MFPALQGDSLPSEPPGKPSMILLFTLMLFQGAGQRERGRARESGGAQKATHLSKKVIFFLAASQVKWQQYPWIERVLHGPAW